MRLRLITTQLPGHAVRYQALTVSDPTWQGLLAQKTRSRFELAAAVGRFRKMRNPLARLHVKQADRKYHEACREYDRYMRSDARRKFMQEFSDKTAKGERGMKPTVYLVVGVPGSGKSWVCEQLKDEFTYVHHDGFIGHINQPEVYVDAIVEAASETKLPILAEAPFSISAIKEPLEAGGFEVVPVFILEDPEVLRSRYETDPNRDGKPLPKGHLTRMSTYAQRAQEWGAFSGTSSEVFDFLKGIAGGTR